MAVPKRKMSRARTRNRKAQWRKTTPTTTTTCPRCKSVTRAHAACPTCGNYKGRQVVEVE